MNRDPVTEAPDEQMRRWTAAAVSVCLKANDLEGVASTLYMNGVRGRDLLNLSSEVLQFDLRLSAFVSHRVLAARDLSLQQTL